MFFPYTVAGQFSAALMVDGKRGNFAFGQRLRQLKPGFSTSTAYGLSDSSLSLTYAYGKAPFLGCFS